MDFNIAYAMSDLFNESPLRPQLSSLLILELEAYYANEVLLVTDSDSEMREFIYGTKSQELYAVLAFTFPYGNGYSGYTYVIIKASNLKPTIVWKHIVALYKDSNDYATLREMGLFIQNSLSPFFRAWEELLEASVRSRRSNSQNKELSSTEYVYPEISVLQQFYECGRKVSYTGKEIAQQHLNHKDDEVYQCQWETHYHVGKAPTGTIIPTEIAIGRWKTAWRRQSNKHS